MTMQASESAAFKALVELVGRECAEALRDWRAAGHELMERTSTMTLADAKAKADDVRAMRSGGR